jgi:hypothetical protein
MEKSAGLKGLTCKIFSALATLFRRKRKLLILRKRILWMLKFSPKTTVLANFSGNFKIFLSILILFLVSFLSSAVEFFGKYAVFQNIS